jgi:putative tryptophan/tyrosine transport system substrate-binding protein
MRRREFVAALGSAAVAWPLAARAQDAGRTYQIGALSAGPRDAPYWLGVFDELRRSGFIEGQNLTIDWHQYAPRVDLVPEFAAELVEAKVDVIVATGDAAIRAAQQATTTIPILGSTDDMIGSGLVNSMARPEGNTTGTSILATELDGKRQEILIEVLPGLRHLAALADSKTTAALRLRSLQDAARARGIELSVYQIAKPDEIPAALEAAKASGAAGTNVLSSPLLYGNRQIIIQRAATLRLPAIYQFPEEAEEGGLIGYTECRPHVSRASRPDAHQVLTRHQTNRSSDPATDQVRASSQPQYSESTRPHNSGVIPGSRGQSNRMKRRRDHFR